MKLKIIEIAGHRNGVAGARFDVVLFKERASGPKVAIVFDEWSYCAVLDVAKLADGDIAFGSNSWRADDYEPYLRDAIALFHGEEPQNPELPARFDCYEIHGVREFGRGKRRHCEQVSDSEAQFWSLYGHIPGQGLDCIGDFATREHAKAIFARITGQQYAPMRIRKS
ncbi:MAG TPA: hypothetical protein VGP68_06085 [Gemmataceae bacterium]|jgi:hypothetical protein|nr:hypothetical protein [Gemmataceae bacterium]